MCSSTHAQIIPREDGWMLQDLGSTNGTMVDGRLIRETPLRPGAEISIGNTTLVLFIGLPGEIDDQQPAEPVPQAPRRAVELAWLLDEELIELKGNPDRTRGNSDIIDQELRLPPGLNAVLEVVAGQDEGKVYRFTRGNITLGRKMGEVPLSDLEVSKRHAVIEVFGREVIFLRDLESPMGLTTMVVKSRLKAPGRRHDWSGSHRPQTPNQLVNIQLFTELGTGPNVSKPAAALPSLVLLHS